MLENVHNKGSNTLKVHSSLQDYGHMVVMPAPLYKAPVRPLLENANHVSFPIFEKDIEKIIN